MKRILKYILLISTVVVSSCAKDIVDFTGSVTGTIKDYDNGSLISNCLVSLAPGGKSVTSSTSGQYSFSDLEAGHYSLTFSKAGYIDNKVDVEIKAGENVKADVLLRSKSPFAVSENNHDFGDLEVSKTFHFFNNSDSDTRFTIASVPSWLSIDKTSGVVGPGGNETVTVTVDRNSVEVGEYSQNLTVSYSGKSSGAVTISIKMKKVVLSAPSVSIAASGEKITKNSFDIAGSITATGGSQITAYGHCWSTSQNPTVNDHRTNLGVTDAIGTFTSTAEGLFVATTYYVRAYAVNAQGTGYSEQIAVTTQDVESNKWDGTKASSFAGGNGSAAKPYLIETGGQILLMGDYPDKNFELAGNIDLDNKNWKPFDFKGKLDGKGYTVSNLKIRRTDECQGLFSNMSGSVSNITLKNVDIETSANYVGAIAGKVSSGTIENVHIFLSSSSQIIGGDYVGGIVGRFEVDSGMIASDCKVSADNNSVIGGTKYVGGLCGECHSKLGSNPYSVGGVDISANISGDMYVGGIIGRSDPYLESILSCAYSGTLEGGSIVGGLIGISDHYNGSGFTTVESCKTDGEISGTGTIGGLIGEASYTELISCYTSAIVRGNSSVGGMIAKAPYYVTVSLCYSTVTGICGFIGDPSTSSFSGATVKDSATTSSVSKGNISNSAVNCQDITSFFRETYSDYSRDYDFNNTWIWEGTINGKTVKVSCPRLAWEK